MKKRKPLIGIKGLGKPPVQKNPSLTAGKNPAQHKPVTLAKVWPK
jgi:hypothetical protein